MAGSFDPYHRWLGIPPKHQPADHYRLLGLERFEDDVEVIRDAAERQMAHVRGYALGKHADLSQKILNELATAKACLLDPGKKAEYDQRLGQQRGLSTAAAEPPSASAPTIPPPPPAATLAGARERRLPNRDAPGSPARPLAAESPRPGRRAAPGAPQDAGLLFSKAQLLLGGLAVLLAFGIAVVLIISTSRDGRDGEVRNPLSGDASSQSASSRTAQVSQISSAEAGPDGQEEPSQDGDQEATTTGVLAETDDQTVDKPPTIKHIQGARIEVDEESSIPLRPTDPDELQGKLHPGSAPVRKPTEPSLAVAPFSDAQAKDYQRDWARSLGIPPEITNSIEMKLVLIPAGELMMGSDESDESAYHDEKPQHRVEITEPFYLGASEVTQEQYQRVMGKDPSRFEGDPQRPVETVSWEDAVEFCWRLSEREGNTYRLPTEAEWEYAARAGSTTNWCFGDSESQLGDYAWYGENSGRTTHPVARKKPNAWGLYDMHGNVWEWCRDWFDSDYYGNSPGNDPMGPSSGTDRVLRGGSWDSSARRCRSALRNYASPASVYLHLGFRVFRVAKQGG